MNVIVYPVGITQINWKEFLRLAPLLLGRSVTSMCDLKKIPLDSLIAWPAILAEFQTENCDPLLAQREGGSILKHAMVNFLIAGDRETLIQAIIDSEVSFLDSEVNNVFIASGTLQQWKVTLLNLGTSRATQNQRVLTKNLLLAFDSLGLSRLFENYSRIDSDNQYGLILKAK